MNDDVNVLIRNTRRKLALKNRVINGTAIRGTDGKTPVRGVDYMTQQDINAIKKDVTPIKGIHYFDGQDGKDGRDGKPGKDGKDGVGKPGRDGKDGKDGSPDTPEEIKGKLESLKGNARLDAKAIKGLDKAMSVSISSIGGGSGNSGYTLPRASVSVLGGIKVGDRLTIDGNGVLSADVQTGATGIQSVVPGSDIAIDNTDPGNPIISFDGTIPTDTNQLTNGAGFITSGDIPAESDPVWNNEKGDYLTTANAALTYEPLLPTTPENPETKYLNGNKQWAAIAIGAGGFAGNLYFTTLDSSDVSGYKQISYINEATETELGATLTNQEVLLRTYLYEDEIATTVIDAGVWVANYRAKVSGSQGVTQLKMEVFLYHLNTTETVLWSDYSPELNNTDYETIRSESNQPAFSCTDTDRLGVRIYAKVTASNAITINTIVGDGDASYFTTPLRIRHNQLRDLNGDINYKHLYQGTYKDTSGVTAIDLENRQLNTDTSGNFVADWSGNTFGVSSPGGYKASLDASVLTQARNITIPDKGGTLAMIDDIPTDVSQLTDSTGVIPTATSDLTNDSGFITSGDIPAESDPVWESEKGNYITSADAALTYEPILPATPDNPETKWLDGNRQWTAVTQGPKTVKLTTNLSSTTSTTVANTTDLSFPVTSGTYYRFNFHVLYRSAATTTGIRLTLTTPAVTTFVAVVKAPVSTSAGGTVSEYGDWITSSGDAVVGTGTPQANVTHIATIEGDILPSEDGTLQVRHASEVGGSGVTVMQGTNGLLWTL